MDNSKILYSKFYQFEKENDLFSLNIDGIYYWDCMRVGVWNELYYRNFSEQVNIYEHRSFILEVIGALYYGLKFKFFFSFLKKSEIVRFRPLQDLLVNNERVDHQYDYFDFSFVKGITDIFALSFYRKIKFNMKHSLAWAEFKLILWKIKRKLLGAQKLPIEQKKVLEIFLNQLNLEYNSHFSIDSLEYEIQYNLAHYKYYSQEIKNILKKVSPKAILVYPSYDSSMRVAIGVAREMNIKSIEVQHGIAAGFVQYWYSDKTAKGKLIPDFFFSYGDWHNSQTSFPHFCKLISIGNSYLERKKSQYPYNEPSNKVLAVISAQTYGLSLAKFIYSMKDEFKQKNIHIMYKFHPSESPIWEEYYGFLKEMDNITFIYDNTSVYDILSKSSFVIGVSSTVLLEAMIYHKIKIFVYTKEEHSVVQNFIDKGYMLGVSDSKELFNYIESNNNNKSKITIPSYEEVWKSNPDRNLRMALNEIL